ncbi:unnamed protein product [Linum trigynum]|uniref:Uncharacterized protein n=1 Tax=Linum trigynum TaxID=586398 RepID=A0AAV2GLA1_9ROSI
MRRAVRQARAAVRSSELESTKVGQQISHTPPPFDGEWGCRSLRRRREELRNFDSPSPTLSTEYEAD